jgi:hypothetical protein
MDNLFDYIVILFFIISAIASMFKSKKKEEAKRAAQAKTEGSLSRPQSSEPVKTDYQPYESKSASTAKSNVLDLFDEKDDDRSLGNENLGSDHSKRGYTLKEMKSEVEKYFEEALLKSQLAEEPVPPPEPVSPPKVEQKSYTAPKSSFRKSSIVDVNRERIVYKNQRAEDIRRRIKNTTELRDLIVINEILNKPKALR